MKLKKTYPGINIQFPISQLILEGKKTIETRTYPIPKKYLGQELLMIETPGKAGSFKARAVAIIKFSKCYKYKSKSEFYADSKKHRVNPDSPWAWKDKSKWGWIITHIDLLDRPIELKKEKGIVFTKEIDLYR
ncbi:MAG: ASCH domain-containing protein [Bacteriovoracaceae bacterium]|nr:ASCH domain-containing protein [Bacteriovoracaceae bacterium]